MWGILLFFLGGIGYNLYQKNTDLVVGATASKIVTQTELSNSYEEQVGETASVTVMVKPTDISEDSCYFEVTLQTHSIDLDMDILKSVILLGDNAEEILPDIWEGDAPDGHHRTGILTFQKVNSVQDEIRLQVKDVGEVSLREFNWPIIKE